MRSLTLSTKHLQQMIAHVDSRAPLEACGLLAGKDSQVKTVIEVTNRAQSPARFVMEPIEQLHAFEWIDSQDLELVAIFHSHPAGPETVSPTDIADSAYDVAQIVLSRADNAWRARGFWIENGAYTEVALKFSNPP